MTKEYIRWERDKIHHTYADMLARIRTGWRIRWDGTDYVIYGPFGPQGLSPNGTHAANYYMWCCANGPQFAYVNLPVWREFLPLPKDDDVSRIDGEHQPTLYDGVPRGP